jgi:uncharacterized protein
MRLFDAACSIGRWPGEKFAFEDVDGLLGEMDRLGIERALVSHSIAWQNSPELGNRLLMQALQASPGAAGRLFPCWAVTPGPLLEAGGGPEALTAEMGRQNVRAVRLYPRDHVFPLADWMAGGLLQALDNRRCLVLLDLDQVFTQVGMYDYDANGLRHVQWMCTNYPNLGVVLSRVGYRAYQDLIPLLEVCPNLHLDTSYFATHQGVEDVVRRFGAQRVVFATAQPLADAGGALTRLNYAALEPAEKELIAHANLERLLGRARVEHSAPDMPIGGQEAPTPAKNHHPLSPQASHPLMDTGRSRLVELALAGETLAQAGVEITDAHGHLGPYHKFYIPDPWADGLVRVMDRCGVAQLALSSHLAISTDWKLGNQQTAEAVARHPQRPIGQVVVNPNEPEEMRAELVHYFDDLGFRAIKLVPDTHLHPIAGPGYLPAWEFAAERGCLLLCHTFHGSRFDDPQLFGELAQRYPQVPIMLVHTGALTAAFEPAIRLAKQYPNLYLDVSGSYITGAWIRRLVDGVGADRVVYSSDIPFIDLRYSLGRVLFARLDDFELPLVLGGNIRRILKLEAGT